MSQRKGSTESKAFSTSKFNEWMESLFPSSKDIHWPSVVRHAGTMAFYSFTRHPKENIREFQVARTGLPAKTIKEMGWERGFYCDCCDFPVSDYWETCKSGRHIPMTLFRGRIFLVTEEDKKNADANNLRRRKAKFGDGSLSRVKGEVSSD